MAITDTDGVVEFTLGHESQTADRTLTSVWATDLGDCYIEVVYAGTGPHGAALVVVVPADNAVIVGDLATDGEPSLEWAAALDLALALTNADTTVWTHEGPISRERLDEAHQHMLEKTIGQV